MKVAGDSKAISLAAESILQFARTHCHLPPGHVGAALTAAVVEYARIVGFSDEDLRASLEYTIAQRKLASS